MIETLRIALLLVVGALGFGLIGWMRYTQGRAARPAVPQVLSSQTAAAHAAYGDRRWVDADLYADPQAN